MTIPSLVLSGRSSPVMTTWLDVMRRADAIDHHGTDPDRVLLTEARDLMTRLLHMADVLDRLSDRPPEPRNTHALKRRRWFVSTKRPQEVASVCDILESDGTGSVRRIELRDGVRPAAMSIRCRPTEAMLPFDSDASHIGPALREAATLMRTSLAHLSDPRAPDPLVVPDLIQDAAAAVVMRLGDGHIGQQAAIRRWQFGTGAVLLELGCLATRRECGSEDGNRHDGNGMTLHRAPPTRRLDSPDQVATSANAVAIAENTSAAGMMAQASRA